MRLFAAIELPERVRQSLAMLSGGIPGARWVEPDSYHVTLRFIGEVDNGQAADIGAQLAELAAPSFDLELSGIGQFNTGGRPRVVWVGVQSSPALSHLARKIDRAIAAAGLPPEDRNFAPHVSIARLRNAAMPRVARYLSEHALFRASIFTVKHFTLFESLQGNDRPVYVPLADYPLRGDDTTPVVQPADEASSDAR
jgi:2'-5' RNA ligase